MRGCQISTIQHECNPFEPVEEIDNSSGQVAQIVLRWRCPECGQRWRVRWHPRSGKTGHGSAEREWWSGPSRRWRRRAVREVTR